MRPRAPAMRATATTPGWLTSISPASPGRSPLPPCAHWRPASIRPGRWAGCRLPDISRASDGEETHMSLSIRPMLSSLLRSRTGAILVALQITIALAVMVNAVWIVSERIVDIEKPTGIDDNNMFVIAIAGLTSHFDLGSALSADLDYLRGQPGVVAAVASESVPLTGDGQATQLWLQPGQRGRSIAVGEMQLDTQGLKTLGTSIISGRNFNAGEIEHFTPGKLDLAPADIIVTQTTAKALFPDGNALGRVVYDGAGKPITIIGISRDF